MKIVKAEAILISVPFESGGLAPRGWGDAPANAFDTLSHPPSWEPRYLRAILAQS